jgi:hypothetical protein
MNEWCTRFVNGAGQDLLLEHAAFLMPSSKVIANGCCSEQFVNLCFTIQVQFLCFHIIIQQSGYKEKRYRKRHNQCYPEPPWLSPNYTRPLKSSHACTTLTHVDRKTAISSESTVQCDALIN